MKKVLIWIMMLSWSAGITYAREITEEKPVMMRIYGHVFFENKNTPLKNMEVYITKNNQNLGTAKTDKEGYYDFVINNREDSLNICLRSTSFSDYSNINYCTVVSAFQKIGKMVDGIETREVEYDFYTNSNGENLNERTEAEITNSEVEDAYEQMESTKAKYEEELKLKEAEEKREKELEELKLKYKMPNNTEMLGPLDSMQIIGTVISDPNFTGAELIPNKTYITVTDHESNILEKVQLNVTHDFNITVHPLKKGDFFLHPVNLKIENSQTIVDKNGVNIQIFKNEYRLITKEKNIENIILYAKSEKEKSRYVIIQDSFPFLGISIIMICIITIFTIIVKNKIRIKRKDY